LSSPAAELMEPAADPAVCVMFVSRTVYFRAFVKTV
jgi:hypothetical protein